MSGISKLSVLNQSFFKENKKNITEIKIIDGHEAVIEKTVYADKYKNPKFKTLSGNMKKYYDALVETKKEALKKQPADYLTDDSIFELKFINECLENLPPIPLNPLLSVAPVICEITLEITPATPSSKSS